MASLLDDYQGGILGVDIGKGYVNKCCLYAVVDSLYNQLNSYLSINLFYSSTKVPATRKEKLQAELKMLEWHKMANNAAIKVFLVYYAFMCISCSN